jgi:divalent metal cation (Fe/Co/Zn/Cd) transporter
VAGERNRLASRAVAWCAASLTWAALVGVSSLVTGLATSSVALLAFGANSVLDGTASAVLVWRFRHEQSGGDVIAVEERAALAVGVVMAAVALWITASAISALAGHSVPESSAIGIALTSASALVLPVLARAKLRLAVRLKSPGLRGDGVLSLAAGILALATLASLVLDSALGWWWADAVAALLISGVLTTEALRTISSRRSLVQ